MDILRAIIFGVFGVLWTVPVWAWDNHALGTVIALSQMKEVVEAPQVTVETLENFLKAEQKSLQNVLRAEEEWARKSVPSYPPRPNNLAFNLSDEPKTLRSNFIKAIRINPEMKLTLFLQEIPGKKFTKGVFFSPAQVTTMPNSLRPTENRFLVLQPGDRVSALNVIASASDEPDYGLDIGLWSDSKTLAGNQYHFGNQPFGNPTVEFASQAPFHMGFYHEPGIVFKAAPYLAHTLPEYRIHLFFTLARYAFQSGHPYWGWRFAGWGAHYIQDLTQPFHATVFPGQNTMKTLLYGILDLIGIHGPKNRMVQQVTDEHFAIEHYEYEVLLDILTHSKTSDPVFIAMKNHTRDAKSPLYAPGFVRKVLSAQSYGLAERTAAVVAHPFSAPPAHILLTELMANFGTHTRNWVRAILAV